MKSLSIISVALVLFVQLVKSQNLTLPGDELHYYWREYNGNIPTDAIPGGKDARGVPTYIGCAVAKLEDNFYGVYPGSIVTNQKYLEISVDHLIQKSDLFVWILCSDTPNKFHWSRTTSWNFNQEFTATRNPIRGGLQHGASEHSNIYIGRFEQDYEVVVGKIPYVEGETENPLYIASAEKEIKTDDFEVLLLES